MGLDKGITSLKNTVNSPAPSTFAASNNADGILVDIYVRINSTLIADSNRLGTIKAQIVFFI